MPKENDILETTLAIAENGYDQAYRYLLDAYEANPERFGPQTLYFLACLAGGASLPGQALAWLHRAILDNGWWYRPEVLEDDDLAALKESAAFLSLKAISDQRYADAAARSKAVFSWKEKTSGNLFLAIHGNTQNARTAREDWSPILEKSGRWQLETIQSAEPDGYGTYRWRYDRASYLPAAQAIESVQNAGYEGIVCGGFSAGCDMLLRAVLFAPARCDTLILQSPWIPLLQEDSEGLISAVKQKHIALTLLCGSDDTDCLPMAKQLFAAADKAGIRVRLRIQEGCQHQFPAVPCALEDLL